VSHYVLLSRSFPQWPELSSSFAARLRRQPLKNDIPGFHWRSAALAGIAAGVAATLFQIALWWASSEPLPGILFRDARLTAAILMGRRVLPPPATFDGSVMLVATLVHFALSIAYGLGLSAMLSRPVTPLGLPRRLLVGAVFGLVLYAVNMHGFTLVFPWFSIARDWITAATHAVFGMVVAMVYSTYRLQSARSSQMDRKRPA
jgi:hypothetical protein